MTSKICVSLGAEFTSFVFSFSFNGFNLIPFMCIKENGHEGLGVVENREILIKGYQLLVVR